MTFHLNFFIYNHICISCHLFSKIFSVLRWDFLLSCDGFGTDIILGREDAASDSWIEIKVPICFYDVLADHFSSEPEHGKPILAMIVQLWSQPFASHIFALLFHKWVCNLCRPLLFYAVCYCVILNFNRCCLNILKILMMSW